MHYVYILYSNSTDKFYIGESKDPSLRLSQHNSGHFPKSFTTIARDWTIFLVIECQNIRQARNIEQHIKRMKSKRYILNLKTYPDIIKRLLDDYKL